MSTADATAREEFTLRGESALWLGTTAADTRYNFIVFAQPWTMTLREARRQLRELEQTRAQQLATEFLQRIGLFPHVSEVWADWLGGGLEMTVVVSERNLDEELRLYAAFREVASGFDDPAFGDLAILPAPFEPPHAELLYRSAA